MGVGKATLFDPATFQFRGAGTPIGAVDDFSFDPDVTVALPDGRALIVGEDVELYDPVTRQFTLTSSEPGTHGADSAVVLKDGRVLVLGGGGAVKTAGIYDPANGTFSRTGSMKVARQDEAVALLSDGRVLVAGGDNLDLLTGTGTMFSSAETYNPASGQWTLTGSMSKTRSRASATLLGNGKVLVAGGLDNHAHGLATAELYDPATGKFTATGSMSVGREGRPATLLRDGRVLVVGSDDSDGTPKHRAAEIYDPSTGKFSATETLTLDPNPFAAVLLPDGDVLVVGSDTYATIYRP
jgi:hypothetical protein